MYYLCLLENRLYLGGYIIVLLSFAQNPIRGCNAFIIYILRISFEVIHIKSFQDFHLSDGTQPEQKSVIGSMNCIYISVAHHLEFSSPINSPAFFGIIRIHGFCEPVALIRKPCFVNPFID
jgi:hypothetical protein